MLTYSFLLMLLLCCGTGICAVATELQLSLSDTWNSNNSEEAASKEFTEDHWMIYIEGTKSRHGANQIVRRTKFILKGKTHFILNQ